MPTHQPRGCITTEHALHRRQFLGALTAGGAATWASLSPRYGLADPSHIAQARSHDKRVIIIYLGGGASQLETWDPKPGQPTGGPFLAVSTSVPGVAISELLPKLATRMHRLALVRSVDNSSVGPDHHGSGVHLGRARDPAVKLPTFAELAVRELATADTKVPSHVELQVTDTFRYETEFGLSHFGTRYSPLVLTGGKRPADLARAKALDEIDHRDREALRDLFSRRFERDRLASQAESYSRTHAQVRGIMACDELLDVDRAPAADLDRYGPAPIARHCLLARRLVEAGVTVVKIRDTWWDTHADNFEGHRSKCANLDHALSNLLDDLVDRGLYENTLVLTLSEFGRTPTISAELGRDHFPHAWSVALGGSGIHGGAVVGKTDALGTEVIDRKVAPANLFATYFKALRIDPLAEFHVGPRPITLVDPSAAAISELLT